MKSLNEAMSKLQNSKLIKESYINLDYGFNALNYISNGECTILPPKNVKDCKIDDTLTLNGNSYVKIDDNTWKGISRQEHVIMANRTDEDIQKLLDEIHKNVSKEDIDYISNISKRLDYIKMKDESITESEDKKLTFDEFRTRIFSIGNSNIRKLMNDNNVNTPRELWSVYNGEWNNHEPFKDTVGILNDNMLKEDSERVEFVLGKEKRYIDPEKDRDLLDQLEAIKRKISHLEKYVSILSIDGLDVEVNFKCEGLGDFSYIVVKFDPDLFGSIKEAYINGSTYITEELIRLCNEINELRK